MDNFVRRVVFGISRILAEFFYLGGLCLDSANNQLISQLLRLEN